MEDLKCELEVHVRAYQHQRSLRGSELSLVTIVKFTIQIDILDCKSPAYSESDTSRLIRSSTPSFSFGTSCFINCFRSSHPVSYLFFDVFDVYA